MEPLEYTVTGGSPVELVLQPDPKRMNEMVLVAHADGISYTGSGESYSLLPRSQLVEEPFTEAAPSGGYPALTEYIRDNIRMPGGEDVPAQATVVLGFRISKRGKITDIESLQSSGSEYAEEAIRLLTNGPSWIPASGEAGPRDEEIRLRILFKK
jgi:TonB family protein